MGYPSWHKLGCCRHRWTRPQAGLGSELKRKPADISPLYVCPFSSVKLHLPPSAALLQALVADVLGDSRPEMLVLTTQGDLIAFSIPYLRQIWRYRLSEANGKVAGWSVAVGQVDDDPTHEIIISGGYVVDAAKNAEEWRRSEGFGTSIRVGDIDADDRDEIVGHFGGHVDAYDAELQALSWQITGIDSEIMELADVTGDATPEVLLGERGVGQVAIYDSRTQALLWGVRNPDRGVCGLGAGDANSDGEIDIIWGAGWDSTGANHLYLAPASQRSYRFVFPSRNGPYRPVAVQMDEDPPLELLVGTHANYNQRPKYFVVDSATGFEQPELTVEVDGYSSGDSWPTLVANVDSDAAQEIVISTGKDMFLLDNNGRRLAKKQFPAWRAPDWVDDVDGDGELELVSHSANTIAVHRIDTLEVEWESGDLGDSVETVVVADTDRDGRQEIVFHLLQRNVRAYDGQTHELKWQMPSSQCAKALAIGDVDGDGGVEIVTIEDALWQKDWITFYNGATHELITRTARLKRESGYGRARLDLIPMTNGPHLQVVASVEGSISLFAQPYDEQPTQVFSHSWARLSFADVDGDRHMDLLVGDVGGMVRYRAQTASDK